VHVTDSDGKSIRRIMRPGRLLQSKQQLDHLLDLPLVRTSVSHDGTLDFSRRVLAHFASRFDRGQDRNAPRVSELERTSRIRGVEHVLDDDQLRPTF
jgi:hypothetical protein